MDWLVEIVFSLIQFAWTRFKKILGDHTAPPSAIKDEFCYYTIITSVSDRRAIVQIQQNIRFRTHCKSLDVGNPFYAEAIPTSMPVISDTADSGKITFDPHLEATLDSKSVYAFVNDKKAGIRHYGPDSKTAFAILYDFEPNKDYEVFTVSKYINIRPCGEDREIHRRGTNTTISAKPHRIWLFAGRKISKILIDLFFIDTSLADEPEVLIYKRGSTSGQWVNDMHRRSIFMNHFFWELNKVIIGERYEITWLSPDPSMIIEEGLGSSTKEIPGELGLLTTFFEESFLVEPRSVIRSINRIRNLLQGANQQIVIIDPHIDNSILGFCNKVKPGKGVKVVFIASKKAVSAVDRAEFEGFFSPRKIQYDFKICERIHDRFIIIDGYELYWIGSSFNRLAHKVSLMHRFSENNALRAEIIRLLFDYCGMN